MVSPFKYLLLLCAWGIAQSAWAQRCLDMAKTPMEEVFCQVQAADAQALQVTLGEFRRNPENTQRLLLRRPAQRLGLTLPETEAGSPSAPPVEPVPDVEPVAEPSPSESAGPAVSPPPDPPAASESSTRGPSELAACTLQTQALVCDRHRFELLGNQPNSALPEGALEHTTLLLSPRQVEEHHEGEDIHRYLSRAYGHYIRKMAAIGLAGATMSYTKFYHTFEQSQVQGTDFGQRMTQMFEFLKEDKRNLQVQTHYTQERPKSVEQCVFLDEQWVVCDDVHNNWVYRRVP